jgi:hypothetical protein
MITSSTGIDRLSPDRFGHWVVAGKKYTNKLKAVIDAVKIGHWIHWDFNESVFSKYDWTKEPDQSLQALYDQRARQIRDQYSFVALEFSGGSDSWNMLYAFCRQKLKVDLVIHKYVGSTVKGPENRSAENHWAEGKYQAWYWYNKLLELNPDMKWATWDIEDSLMDGWKEGPVDIMFHNNLHPGAIVKNPDRTNINPFGIPDLPSTAYVLGIDKPVVSLRDDGYYLSFYDNHLLVRGFIERSLLGIGWDDILFYWDPNCVPLMIKQAHTVMNFFKNHPEYAKFIKSSGPRGWSYKDFIINLIYPNYRYTWQSEKPQGTFSMTHENFFINNMDNFSSKQWHKNLNQYSDTLKYTTQNTDFAKYTKTDVGPCSYTVLNDCPSKHYYLGPP